MGDSAVSITPEFLSELESVANAASAGPWRVYQPSEYPDDYRFVVGGAYDATRHNGGYIGRLTQSHSVNEGSKAPRKEDAQFIASANPAVVLALIAKIRELSAKT